MLNELAKRIHKNNKSKGFYEGDVNIAEKLAFQFKGVNFE